MGFQVVRILGTREHVLHTPRTLCIHHVGMQSGQWGPGHAEQHITRWSSHGSALELVAVSALKLGQLILAPLAWVGKGCPSSSCLFGPRQHGPETRRPELATEKLRWNQHSPWPLRSESHRLSKFTGSWGGEAGLWKGAPCCLQDTETNAHVPILSSQSH